MERKTHNLDATGKIAGRLASRIAFLLQGKHKPSYQAHTDCGDVVEVSNAGKMIFSGRKLTREFYHRFTGYPGGIRSVRLDEFLKNKPEALLRKIVYNMLPKNRLRAKMLNRLHFVAKENKK